ncbi:Ca-activated chloride channel family protein [Hydrobacter penzbergensis]|uniref:Ca-activated chloride channel family protein n=1 Tax=Hydrobacter penzbergensis TaxID=1235997 RepID=A0A8X8IHN7_9BACT|nr:von Willebrand factor type A domain-containing protein [Hydrobacter penzbergensis]SDX04342.1 Ca-activated chloride channel family protein [Hydrobacter penzbergensis]
MKYKMLLGCLLLVMATAFVSSSREVSGRVVNESGKPVSKARISIKGTQTVAVADSLGRFNLLVNNDQAVLIITAAGFETREQPVGKHTQVTVHLKSVVQAVTLPAKLKEPEPLQDMIVMGSSLSKAAINTHQYYSTFNDRLRLAGKAAAGVSVRQNNLHLFPITREPFNREGYDHIEENPFLKTGDNPLSTFSIDVDAASYSNVRRILNSGELPEEGAVRIEEMINYFHYRYDQPKDNTPFSVHTEAAVCPWNTSHQLVLIGLQGKQMEVSELPPSNLTFLIDVSGSMFSEDKLPLVKASLKLLVDQLRPADRVAIVVYAGNAGLVLPSTDGEHKAAIRDAIDRLEAGGSTAGGAGIQLAYKVAQENFNKKGNNRVILCTDGDFNVGASSDDALERLIEGERKSGVYLTVLGYGTDNYQDAKMQKLADKGNGNHAYIDGIAEAKKVLIHEFGGTLYTIAKDVKLQVEFNPAKVQAYRLIGYENRILTKEDFNNDQKDAGDMGSGHTVTALYEIVPPGVAFPDSTSVDPLRYQKVKEQKHVPAGYTSELMFVKLRYKDPGQETSKLLSMPVQSQVIPIEQASENFRFAASVASFGMLLRQSKYKGSANYTFVKALAEGAIGKDAEGYRKEMIGLIDKAAVLSDSKELVHAD